jgi:hypothetical protein
MAGQVSIPVRNRSGRVIAVAGLAALIVATSQWAYWAGLANWDLLSLIPGFARATNLTANQYPGEDGFACANKSIGSKANLMSDELKQSVGQALCSDGPSLQTAALRGSDGTLTLRLWNSRRNSARRQFDRIAAPVLRAAPVEPRHIALASIDHKNAERSRGLLEDLDRSGRRSDLITPVDRPVDPVDDPVDVEHDKPMDEVDLRDDDHSGSGRDGSDELSDDRDADDNSGPGSGDDPDDHSGSSDDHEEFETAEDDHSGSGSDGDHEEVDLNDDDNSGSGSDGDSDDESDDDNSGSGSSNSGSGHS